MDIARGYEPVAKLDINIMASRQALSKMGFPNSEINKIDAVGKARKHFVKRSQELVKLSKKGKVDADEGLSVSPESPVCDICINTHSGIKLTSPEQEAKVPPDWEPFTLFRFGLPDHNNYRAYILLSPGIVIDYQIRKVYVVCGNCRVILRLIATESGILIHNKAKGTGYGFVDLDRVEKLIRIYKTGISAGNRIDCLIDFDVAIYADKIWK